MGHISRANGPSDASIGLNMPDQQEGSEDVSPGSNSSASSDKPKTNDAPTTRVDESPATATENPSNKGAADGSTAGTAASRTTVADASSDRRRTTRSARRDK